MVSPGGQAIDKVWYNQQLGRVAMRIIVKCVLGAVLCLAASPATPATIRVDWAGSGDYTTIQGGIGAAGTGDTVLVLAGTYSGAGNRNLDFAGTNLVLMSEGGYSVTVIDCGDAARGFYFGSGEDTTSVVSGFRIMNAAADSGAGAFCVNGSDPRFEDCLFDNNTAEIRGGGLCCANSSPIVRSCRFEINTAYLNETSSSYGGGMDCLGSSAPLIEDTDFVLNSANTSGGGLYSYYAAPNCVGCEFVENNLNTYGTYGAGAKLAFSDGAAFTECTFRENGLSEVIVGGGLHVSASDVMITDCVFIANRGGNSGGIHFTESSSGTVTGCTFAQNWTAWGFAAAGLACYFTSNITISNCTFADHQGDHIWCDGSSPTIEYSILAFSSAGVAVACQGGTETPYIHHCFVYGNAAGDTLCGGNFSDIENLDPLFCDMAGEDFTLRGDSPCLPGSTWPSLVGAHGEGCPSSGIETEPTTWGTIKAMYR
jgi:hypothetical protein